MDILHILLTFYMQGVHDNNPEDIAVCKEEFPTFFVVATIFMVLGYLSILRMIYLIFPHLVGYKYFAYKQSQDTLQSAGESKDLNVYSYSSYFRE